MNCIKKIKTAATQHKIIVYFNIHVIKNLIKRVHEILSYSTLVEYLQKKK